MKLAFKIAVAVTIVIAVVLGLDGLWRVQRQIDTFEKDTRRDHLSMGRATAASITEAWIQHGESLAMDLVAGISRKTRQVSIRWIDLTKLEIAFQSAEVGEGERDKVLSGQAVSNIRVGPDDGKRMFTFVPVRPEGKTVGVIEISESLANQSRHVRQTVLRSAATTIAAILICFGATLLLGVYLIGRPIRTLVQQAARIGRGDFEHRIRVAQRDEIADLSEAMNAMAGKLNDAVQQIETRTKAHLETLEQLRHADRLKTVGQLTSSVVHEVGTPLTVITGRAKMIQSAEAEGEEARDCARIVVEQAEKVTKTVRQILDFARVAPRERKVRDICVVVRQLVQLLHPVAVKAGIYLTYRADRDAAFAQLDENQIQQVLANLIINAIQASRSGGHVTVAVEEERATPPEDVGYIREKIWSISVKDEGCGIPAETVPRIFESFYTTKTSGDGTGLGLAISKEIVREHGGWMLVDSQVDRGSTFKVYLPYEEKPA